MLGLRVSTTINANIQNEINKSIIFHYLCQNARAYRAKIAEELKLSAPAVSRAIERLIDDEFVVESDKIPTGKGKKAAQLMVNTDKGFIVGIDLIKEPTRFAVSNFKGEITNEYSGFKFRDNIDIEKELGQEIDRILSSYGTSRGKRRSSSKLKAICIGIPAATTSATHPSITSALYRSLEGVDLTATLEKRYKAPVYIENIVKLSALAEKNYGVGKDYENLVFLEVSNGIGAGIILENHIVRGANGASGEVGFTVVGRDNLDYVAENQGFLEKNASIEGIRRKAIERIQAGRKTLIFELAEKDLKKVNAAVVCRAAFEKDRIALDILGETVDYLAIAIINLILTLNPELIVLGGDICTLPYLDELILRPIVRRAERIVPFPMPRMAKSSLGEHAGIMGASYLAIESLLVSYFPYRLSTDTRG
jgi:N-acetylglucosamine repressor